MYAIALLLQSEPVDSAQYAGPYFWSYFFGWSVAPVLVPPPAAGDPRSPVTFFGLKLVTGLYAHPYGRRSPVRLQPK